MLEHTKKCLLYAIMAKAYQINQVFDNIYISRYTFAGIGDTTFGLGVF